MIDEKINKSLQELETELRSISAARKQVDETVRSFTGLKLTTSGYVDSLNEVSNTLTKLIEGVDNTYKKNVNEFEKDRSQIVKSAKEVLNKVETTTDEIKNTVHDTVNSVQGKLNFILIINIIVVLCVAYIAFVK